MSTAIDAVKSGLIPAALESAIAFGAISSRSITLIATASKTLLWTMLAASIAAIAIQVIAIVSPVFFATFSFFPYIIIGVLSFSAIGSALAALSIERLAPEKELEANIQILGSDLANFDTKIDIKLPAILKSLAERDDSIARAVQELDAKNKELVKVAHDMGQMLPAAEDNLKRIQEIKAELFKQIEDLKQQVMKRSQVMESINEILIRIEKQNPYGPVVSKLEERASLLSSIEGRQQKRDALMQVIEEAVREGVQRTASIDKVLSSYAGEARDGRAAFVSAKKSTEILCGLLRDLIDLLQKEALPDTQSLLKRPEGSLLSGTTANKAPLVEGESAKA